MAQNVTTASRSKAVLALLVAIAADGAQLFLNTPLALFFGVGAEAVDVAIDVVTAIVVIGLLGYSPILLPTILIEAIPLADDIPTWTACVLYLIWKRRGRAVLPSR